MPSIVELVATITGKIDGFRQSMSQGAAATEGFASAWSKASRDVSTAASRIGATVGTVAAGVVTYAAKMGIAFNSMKEDALTDFTVMLQSATQAKEMLEDIQDFAAKTPLETTDLTQAARTLLNFGVAGETVMPMLKRLGDASGGNAQRFSQMALAYGQVSATGRLMGQDLLQLINAGFNPLQEISKRTGESMAALKKRMEDGKISIFEVNQAFVDATSEGGRFFGLMDARAGTLSGLLSTMADNAKQSAGKIFEPVSVAFKDTVGKIIAMTDSGEATRWIDQMRAEVANVAREIQLMLSANGGEIIRSIGDGFLYGARGAAELVKWLRESGPEIARQTSEWLAFLKPVGQWISDHPKAVAGFVALAVAMKALALFGVITAFGSLTTAIGSTISLLTALPGMILAVKAAALSAMPAIVALFANPAGMALLAVLAAAAAAFYKVYQEAAKANAEADKLERRRSSNEKKQQMAAVNFQGASSDETKAVLEQHKDQAQKNLAGLKAQQNAVKDRAADQGIVGGMFGSEQRDADELDRRIGEHEQFIGQLEQRLNEMTKPIGEAIGNAAGNQMIQLAPKAGENAADAENRKKIDKAIGQHRNDADDANFHGYDKIRDFVGMDGVNGGDVEKFTGSQKGVTPEMASTFARLFEESNKSEEALDELTLAFVKNIKANDDFAKRVDKVGDQIEGMSEKFGDMKGQIPDAEIKQFMGAFEKMSQAFLDGKITADQYRDSLKNLNNRAKDAQHAGAGAKGLDEAISHNRRKLIDPHGDGSVGSAGLDMVNSKTKNAAFAKFDEFESTGKKLAESLKAGQISTAQFNVEMQKLKKATDDVTESAMREEAEKRKQALLKGDFAGAGLDFNKSVQDKVAQGQMQLFDQAVTDFVNQFIPLTQYTQQISDGFNSLSGQVTKFGTDLGHSLSGVGGGGGQNSASAEAIASFQAWTNSVGGMIAQAQNQISFHQQALEFLTDPTRIQQEIDAINGLTNEIRNLNKSVSTFNGYRSYDPIFRDPGISGTASNNVLHNTVNVSVPNMVNASQGEIDYLANQVSASLARQGNGAFK